MKCDHSNCPQQQILPYNISRRVVKSEIVLICRPHILRPTQEKVAGQGEEGRNWGRRGSVGVVLVAYIKRVFLHQCICKANNILFFLAMLNKSYPAYLSAPVLLRGQSLVLAIIMAKDFRYSEIVTYSLAEFWLLKPRISHHLIT